MAALLEIWWRLTGSQCSSVACLCLGKPGQFGWIRDIYVSGLQYISSNVEPWYL